VKGIQVFSNKGPGPIKRGDNHKNGVGSFKIFSRTTGPNLKRLSTNHSWGRGFKFVQKKGIALLQGEIILKIY
jgi:hypothetical protein